MMINFDNDAAILSATLQEKAGSAIRLLIAGNHTPDGEPITMLVPQVNAEQASQWCNHVRGELNARKNRKEAAEASRSDAGKRGSKGADTSPERAGGNGAGAEPGVPHSEEELETYLKEAVARLVARREEIKSAMFELDNELSHTERALKRSRMALAAFGEEQE